MLNVIVGAHNISVCIARDASVCVCVCVCVWIFIFAMHDTICAFVGSREDLVRVVVPFFTSHDKR